MDDSLRKVLLLEMQRLIADSASQVVDPLEQKRVAPDLVSYPPNPTLAATESDALNTAALSPEALSGLRKLVADATASAFFDLLCMVDGVAAPEITEVEDWVGARILPAPEDAEDEPMWHDDLFDAYWDYVEKVSSND